MHIDMCFIKKFLYIALNLLWFCSIVELKFLFLNVSFKLDFYLQTKLSVSILAFGIRRAC